MNVYIIQSHQYFKIGKANDVWKRFDGLQVGNPKELTLIATLQTKKALATEREIHAKLKKHRVRGEWFILNIKQVESLMKRYNFKRSEWEYQSTISVFTSEDIDSIGQNLRGLFDDEPLDIDKEIEKIQKESKAEFKEWQESYKKRLAAFVVNAIEKGHTA